LTTVAVLQQPGGAHDAVYVLTTMQGLVHVNSAGHVGHGSGGPRTVVVKHADGCGLAETRATSAREPATASFIMVAGRC